jgi:hypothetical protein
MDPEQETERGQTLSWIRLCVAVLLVGLAAASYFMHVAHRPYRLLDPATVLYPVAILGLSLRFFWARFLTICYVVGMAVMKSAWASADPRLVIGAILVVLLLAGEPMRAMFEGRSGRYNSWADRIAHVEPLKRVFILQSVALAVLFPAAQLTNAPVALLATTLALASFGIIGLVFQRAWALVALLAAAGLEAWVAATALGELASTGMYAQCPATPWPELAVGVAATGSLLVLAPFIGDVVRFLRR